MATLFCNPRSSRSQGQERMAHGGKVKPQATLCFVSGGPPVLDPVPTKPRSNTTGSWPAWTRPGYVLSHLSNMLRTPPPVRWVNPQVVLECPPPQPPSLPQYQVMPYSIMDQSGILWHSAPPGGLQHQQQMMMDPQQMLQSYNTGFPYSKMEEPCYPSNSPPNKAPSKSLNPNAKEWVPRDYRKDTPAPPAMPTTARMGCVEKMIPLENPLLIPYTSNASHDFCEITEDEVKNLRANGCCSSLDVAATSSSADVRQCQVPVPQCPTVTTKHDENELTGSWTSKSSPKIEESVKKMTKLTCSESKPTVKSKVESPVQSESNCILVSRAVTPEKSDGNSESLTCVTSFCDDFRESESLEQSSSQSQRSQCSGENSASPTLPCLKPEDCGRPRPTSGSLGSDEVQVSVASPTERLISTNEHQEKSSYVSPARSTSETQTTSPKCQPSSHDTNGLDCEHPLVVTASLDVPLCLGSATETSTSLSYAGVLGRATPSPPPQLEAPEQQKYKGVEQPLPRIFQVDKITPKEGEITRVEDQMTPELFRRPSKDQRIRSRKFLQELKETGRSGSDGEWSGSPSSTSSTSSHDLSCSPDDLTSPSSPISSPLVPALTISPTCASPRTPSPSITVPIPVPASRGVMGSPGSTGSRGRSSSESSVGSSDIEFVEQDEVDRAAVKSETPSKGRSRLGLAGKNSFLACILGSPDSDSEEDEEDLDWDEVCEDDTAPVLDDSWETFGFGLVMVECRVMPRPTPAHSPAEAPRTEDCDRDRDRDSSLSEVNKRWEEEVRKDVRGRTEPRVKFGGEKVHPMVVWKHAYREARRGPWEQQARDRERFAQRVANLEPDLSLVLDPGHRRAVYRRLHAPPPKPCFL